MRGFVVSWFFPPNNSSEGLVTFKLLKRSRFNYDVFTQKIHSNWSYGATEHKLINKNITPYYSSGNSYDEWINEGIEYFKKNQDKYDFIMTRTTPKESHLVGLALKKLYPEKLWIASFGDPLCNSPYEKLDFNYFPYSIRDKRIKDTSKKYLFSVKRIVKNIIWYRNNKELIKNEKKARKIQDLTLKNADIIILNNDYQFKYMLEKYDNRIKEKVVIIPHSFEKEFYTREKGKSDVINISYLGHLDDIRNAKAFLEAIKVVKEEVMDLSKRLKVNFYGNLSNSDKLYIINNELFDVVNIKKPVDYLTSLKIMENSDWLLMIDANLSSVYNCNIYFPAKLADYIGTNNNIMAITMENGATSDIMKEIGALRLNHNYLEIKKAIIDILEGNIKNIGFKNQKKYDNSVVAVQFDEIVLKALKSNHKK